MEYKKLKIPGAVIGAIASVYTGLLVFGYELPRPAWSNEMIQVAQERVADRLDFLLYKRKEYKRDWRDNKSQQEQYAPGEKPDWLLDEQNTLEEDLKQMESEIKALEKKKYGE